MISAITISAVTCFVMILAVLFLPKIKIGRVSLSSYWVVTVIGAAALLLSGTVNCATVGRALITNSAINPLKILVLFISMTVLSIYLDELGFFRFLANWALERAGKSQTKLFLFLYVTVSVLTVFTSNDIIILSFTPFVCYFAKNARIDPTPYLAAEFVAANTWSMALIIGNPTNIYLVTAAGGDFLSYLKVMFLPTLGAGAVSCVCLFLLFRKKFASTIEATVEEVKIEDKLSLRVGIVHLAVCTVALAVASYIDVEMWSIAFASMISLFVCNLLIAFFRRQKPTMLGLCLKRAPWELVPFVISMFVMVEALRTTGVTGIISGLLGTSAPIWKYGVSSFFASNLINNIPMSVLFSSILESFPGKELVEAVGTARHELQALFATVIGSNLGACFTPIGALAGIMWSSILRDHGLKFGYLDFLKIGVTIAVPTLIAALGVLEVLI